MVARCGDPYCFLSRDRVLPVIPIMRSGALTGMSLFAKLAGQDGVGVFEVVLIRSLALIMFSLPTLLWQRLNPFGDSRWVPARSKFMHHWLLLWWSET